MYNAERHLIWFVRVSAAMFLFAAPAVVMPTAWMSGFYERFGLGTFPDVPLMQYLARSVSALYAMMGASYWFMSLDVRRYLPLLRFTVPCTFVFDVTVIVLDVWIDMPVGWTLAEAVAIFGWTGALWWLLRRVQDSASP